MNKYQLVIKCENYHSAISKKHQYLLKNRPDEIERDIFVFKKSPFNETERVFDTSGDLINNMTNKTFKEKKIESSEV